MAFRKIKETVDSLRHGLPAVRRQMSTLSHNDALMTPPSPDVIDLNTVRDALRENAIWKTIEQAKAALRNEYQNQDLTEQRRVTALLLYPRFQAIEHSKRIDRVELVVRELIVYADGLEDIKTGDYIRELARTLRMETLAREKFELDEKLAREVDSKRKRQLETRQVEKPEKRRWNGPSRQWLFGSKIPDAVQALTGN